MGRPRVPELCAGGAISLSLGLALVAGCTFHPPGGSGGPSDAPDAPVDPDAPDAPGGPTDTCMDVWRKGTVQLKPPVHLPELGSPATDRDPYISRDEKTIYLSTFRPGAEGGDIYVATRADLSTPFSTPTLESNLSSLQQDTRVTMTADGLIAIVASGRDPVPASDLSDYFYAARPNTQASFSNFNRDHLDLINTVNPEWDPELSADGLHLYAALDTPQRIFVASRASTDDNFGSPEEIEALTTGAGEADPSISSDERVILYTSQSSGNGELMYATRGNTTDDFGTPKPVPAVNSPRNEADAALSADGCRLYFASDKLNGFEIYVAEVMLP